MRSAECGMRSLQCEVMRSDTHPQNSALRIPHSAFWLPYPEQLKPPLVAPQDPLAVGRVLGPRQRGIALDDPRRRPARGLEQRQIALQVGVAQRYAAVLARARELTHAALLQVQLGDLETVRRLGEGAQPRLRLGDVAQQNAVALRRAAAHPAPP